MQGGFCAPAFGLFPDNNYIEHNLDVIKSADWIIDLGPEGGIGGGEIVAVGTPEEVARCEASYTGQYLKRVLEK